MGTITLAGRPLQEGDLLGKLPKTIAGHLYLIYTDDNGDEFIISGYPHDETRDLIVESKDGDYLVKFDDSTESDRDQSAADFIEMNFGDRDHYDVIMVMAQYAQEIDEESINYVTPRQNSNSVAASLLDLVGIDVDDVLPNPSGVQVFGFPGIHNILEFDYSIIGTDGNDFLRGRDKDQTFSGMSGDDHLIGGKGNDTLDGGADNDRLVGGQHNDLLTGGDGADIFQFDRVDGRDWITDFSPSVINVTLLDFEGLTTEISDAFIVPDGYGGLNWDNFRLTHIDFAPISVSGYQNGTISGDYTAHNSLANPATIEGTDFSLVSGYFTAAWNNGLSLTVTTFDDGALVGSQNFALSYDAPLLIDFSDNFYGDIFNSIDRATFVSFGGVDADPIDSGSGQHFALDDLVVGYEGDGDVIGLENPGILTIDDVLSTAKDQGLGTQISYGGTKIFLGGWQATDLTADMFTTDDMLMVV